VIIPHFRTVTDAGAARPWLMMVHGASQNSNLFSAQEDAFSRGFNLLLIDLPGHGASRNVPGPFGLRDYASAVRGAMAAADVGEAHYWGTHTGAGIGLLLAVEEPALFTSLILEGAVLPGISMPSVVDAAGRARRLAQSHGVEAAIQDWFDYAPWFDVIRRHPAECRAADQLSLLRDTGGAFWLHQTPLADVPCLLPSLREVHAKTLLINGENDVPDFIDVAVKLQEVMPNVSRMSIARGGGFPLWEFPDAVNSVVLKHLA